MWGRFFKTIKVLINSACVDINFTSDINMHGENNIKHKGKLYL
jgi:hypothetical protein